MSTKQVPDSVLRNAVETLEEKELSLNCFHHPNDEEGVWQVREPVKGRVVSIPLFEGTLGQVLHQLARMKK